MNKASKILTRKNMLIAIAALAALAIATAIVINLAKNRGEPDRSYDEAEVISAAEALLEKAIPLNEIYYGEGIGYHESGGVGNYKEARSDCLLGYGIASVDDLKLKTREVFTEAKAELIFSTLLSSVKENDEILTYARYYQYTDDSGVSHFMVNSIYEYNFTNTIEYGDEITVSGVEGKKVKVSIPATLTRIDADGNARVKNTYIEVEMIEEADGWRFNNDCYSVYNELSDKYDELNK